MVAVCFAEKRRAKIVCGAFCLAVRCRHPRILPQRCDVMGKASGTRRGAFARAVPLPVAKHFNGQRELSIAAPHGKIIRQKKFPKNFLAFL